MTNKLNQKNISLNGPGNKFVGNNDNSTYQTINNNFQKGKLSTLFLRLKEKFADSDTINQISDDLKRYIDKRDTIGLEEKLENAGKKHLYDDFAWLKQEFHKKLVKYQYYEPAQEIFAYILAIVLERYRNIIKPRIQNKEKEEVILGIISREVVNPILQLIHDEGCDDIMGLTATEIEGMFHYLTGNCHIKWD